MLWYKGGRYVFVKEFWGSVYPNYWSFIHDRGINQSGFYPGYSPSDSKKSNKHFWKEIATGEHDEDSSIKLSVIERILNGELKTIVIKSDALKDEQVNIGEYNNIWK